MHKEWPQKGKCTESELAEMIKGQDYQYYVAFQTDRFLSGSNRVESLGRIEFKKLLEIRLFSEKEELLARRTMIGEANHFQWRIASEEGLMNDEFYTRYQTLDIDTGFTREGEYGNLDLMSTGGGTYELPIEENIDCIKVISYISYSDVGMASIYDNRLAGFAKGGEN